MSLRPALDALYRWTGYLAALSLVVIFGLMMILSIGREINFNIPSGDDFTGWALVATAFLGLAYTFKAGDMIRVGLLIERLSGKPKKGAELFALGIAAAYVAYFAWQCWRLAYDSWRFDDMSTGVVSVPLWIPQSAMVIGLLVLLVAVVDEFCIVIARGKPTYEQEPPSSPDEIVERAAAGGGA